MKKLFFMLIAVATLGFVACTNENTEQASNEASQSVEVAEFNADLFAAKLDSLVNAGDTAAVKSLLDQANAEIQKLQGAGDEDALAALIAKVKAAVEGKAEALKGLGFEEAAKTLTTVPENLKEKVDAAAKDIVTNVTDAAADKVNEVKDAAADKVNEVKDAAANKVEDVKQQAGQAIDNAQDKANNAVNDAKKKIGL